MWPKVVFSVIAMVCGCNAALAQKPTPASAPAAALSIDLASALRMARDYNQQFLAAGLAVNLAREDRIQAKAAFLPTVNILNQHIYTEGNGTPSGVFVANNGTHEYNEQAVVHEELFSLARRAEYRRALAAEATARARQDVAARGVVATVVQAYYGLISAQRHVVNAATSLAEARRFLDLTQQQEKGGEVAHADVIKAQLQAQQRERDVAEAQLAVDKARASLAVLLLRDPAQDFTVVDDLGAVAPLTPMMDIQSLAQNRSPDLRAAQALLQQTQYGVAVARGAFYPTLVLDYFYGLNSNTLTAHTPEGAKNYGSSAQATLIVPVWTWGATQSKVRQAQLQQRQAQVDLQFAQRQLQAALTQFYLEAQTARTLLESLRLSLDLSAESLRLTLLRYQAGEATALEVVDAQTTLVLARNGYDDGLARYRVALASLQTLTGVL